MRGRGREERGEVGVLGLVARDVEEREMTASNVRPSPDGPRVTLDDLQPSADRARATMSGARLDTEHLDPGPCEMDPVPAGAGTELQHAAG
jgi:hypothetical protein